MLLAWRFGVRSAWRALCRMYGAVTDIRQHTTLTYAMIRVVPVSMRVVCVDRCHVQTSNLKILAHSGTAVARRWFAE